VEEKLLTPTDVAERLQLQERTVTRWLRTGYLRGFKLGKEWRVSSKDLYSFIEQHANTPLDKTA
jgi:excisionase family DNA binding protein